MTVPPPMIKKFEMFSLTNFLMQAVQNDKPLMIGVSTGNHVFGKVSYIDTQGPWPSIQVVQEEEPPVVLVIAHIISVQVDRAAELVESRKKANPAYKAEG